MAKIQGLEPAKRRKYLQALRSSHNIRIRVFVHGPGEGRRGRLDADVIGGQVDVDGSADITRTLSLTIADDSGKMGWGPGSKVFADEFLSVDYGVWIGDEWADVPVFFGPVSRFERDGGEITIEAVGKESLLLPPRPFTFPKNPETVEGRLLKSYIKHLAASMGESKFSLTSMGGAKISKMEAADAAKNKDSGLWGYLTKLAAGNGFQLYYDTEGDLTARPVSGRKGFHFSDGDDGTILDEPTVSYDLSELRNVVVVKGKDTHGKTVTRAKASLPKNHPLSAQSLAWNGEDRILREIVRFDHEIKLSRAKEVAVSTLRKHSRAPVEVSFESLPIPHLELGDRCELTSGSNPQAVKFTVNRFTLPLGADSAMTVGYTRPYRRKFKARISRG